VNYNQLLNHQYPAVILDMSANGIGICRSLNKKGIKTFAFDKESNYKIGKTRYANCGSCPNPILEDPELLNFLLNLGERLQMKSVLYTGSDDFLEYLSTYRESLSLYFYFLLPDHSLIESVLDKRLTYQLAVEHNIQCPKTFFVDEMEQLDTMIPEITFPCILKPVFSADYRKRMNKKAIIIHDEKQLKDEYQFYLQFGEIMIQEFIPGEESYGYELGAFIDEDETLKGAMTVQKLSQFPPIFGTGTLLISKKDQRVLDVGVSLLHSIKYRGLANVEFKKDSRDGQLKFIEINARPWLWHSLSEPCGINFAYLYYLSVTGQKTTEKLEQNENIKWLFLMRDFIAFLQKRKNGTMTYRNWLQSISGKKVFALFAWNDIMPFMRKSIADLKGLWKQKRK
jgi:D-aspartate ligase